MRETRPAPGASTGRAPSLGIELATTWMCPKLVIRQRLFRSGPKVLAWSGGKEPSVAVRVSSRRAPRATGSDVYVYFDNDVNVRAPFDALALAKAIASGTSGEHGQRAESLLDP